MDADGDFVVAWYDPSSSTTVAPLPGCIVRRRRPGETRSRSAAPTRSGATQMLMVTSSSPGGTSAWTARSTPSGTTPPAPQGGPLRVNTLTAGNQSDPAVSCDADGDFVVGWTASHQVGYGYPYCLRMERPTRDATTPPPSRSARGAMLRGGSRTAGLPLRWSCDADGDFVVTLQQFRQTFSAETYARRFTAGGEPMGSELRVNKLDGPRYQGRWGIRRPDGDFASSPGSRRWRGRRFGITLRPAVRAPGARVTEVFIDGAASAPLFRTFLPTDGMGSAAYGYEVPGGAAQADDCPGRTSTGSASASARALVQQDDLRVRGVNVSDYPPPPSPTTRAPTPRHGRWDSRSGKTACSISTAIAAGVTDTGGTGSTAIGPTPSAPLPTLPAATRSPAATARPAAISGSASTSSPATSTAAAPSSPTISRR